MQKAMTAARQPLAGVGAGKALFLSMMAALWVANLYMIFMWTPTDRVMGVVQRIFYIHVPPLWMGFVAFLMVFMASAVYLVKGSAKWDHRAHAAAEAGVVFLTIGTIGGMIWAKPAWGTWWTWDPRLTATFILWMTYMGYLMVRANAPSRRQGARWAAVVGIVGFVNVPIVYMAATWWRTLHPGQVTGPLAAASALAPEMRVTLYFSVLVFALLFAYMVRQRIAQRESETAIEELQAERS